MNNFNPGLLDFVGAKLGIDHLPNDIVTLHLVSEL